MMMLVPLLWVTTACSSGPTPPAQAPQQAPVRIAPIPLTRVSGEALATRISEASGHVRLFNFWATWCPPCLAEMPLLKAYAHAHPEVELILVNVDAGPAQASRVPHEIAQRGLDELGLLLLDAADPNRTLREHVAGWPEAIPVTLVVSPSGERVAMHVESITKEDLDASVAKARATQAP